MHTAARTASAAGTADIATVAALAAGDPVEWASRWEVALASVVAAGLGELQAQVAERLGESTAQLRRWRERFEACTALIPALEDGTPVGTQRLRRPQRLVTTRAS